MFLRHEKKVKKNESSKNEVKKMLLQILFFNRKITTDISISSSVCVFLNHKEIFRNFHLEKNKCQKKYI